MIRSRSASRIAAPKFWVNLSGCQRWIARITFFFLPRQEAYEEWQVFRFRSVRSRKDLMRGVAAGAKEAGFVSSDQLLEPRGFW